MSKVFFNNTLDYFRHCCTFKEFHQIEYLSPLLMTNFMTQRQTYIFFHMPSTLCHCACAADSLHEYFGNTQALASINLTFICIIFIILQMWHGGAMITLPPPLTGKLIKLSCFQKMMGQKYSYGHGAKE